MFEDELIRMSLSSDAMRRVISRKYHNLKTTNNNRRPIGIQKMKLGAQKALLKKTGWESDVDDRVLQFEREWEKAFATTTSRSHPSKKYHNFGYTQDEMTFTFLRRKHEKKEKGWRTREINNKIEDKSFAPVEKYHNFAFTQDETTFTFSIRKHEKKEKGWRTRQINNKIENRKGSSNK